MGLKTNGFVDYNLPEELMKVLDSIASNWGDVIDWGDVKVVHLSGAMTNEVYRISWQSTKIENVARTVLVRIYGKGVQIFFNRDEEIETFKSISMVGYGPKFLAGFTEGRVEEFIHARTLSATDIRDPKISALIATKMREFHTLDINLPKNVILWNRMRNWLSEAKNLCSDRANEFKLDSLENEIELLEKAICGNDQEIGFCHNDLQYGNIMIDDNKTITIIDYEYASYNPVAYDLANHFNEMAADYHTDTPHVLDYTKYPGLEERQRFIKQYLSSSGQEEASDKMVDELADDVEKYTLANHIFWGLWGLISAYVNNIEFDYLEYARQRFEQYWLRKSEILNVQQQQYH